jgi:hypothetical protein
MRLPAKNGGRVLRQQPKGDKMRRLTGQAQRGGNAEIGHKYLPLFPLQWAAA